MLMFSKKKLPPGGDPLQSYTIAQVAQLLQVGEQTVRNMVDRGEFPKPFKAGRSTRWLASAVQAWIAKQSRR